MSSQNVGQLGWVREGTRKHVKEAQISIELSSPLGDSGLAYCSEVALQPECLGDGDKGQEEHHTVLDTPHHKHCVRGKEEHCIQHL